MWLPDRIESQDMGQPKRAKVTRKSKGQRRERKSIPSGDGASPTHERPQKKKIKREVNVDLSPSLSPERANQVSVDLSPSSLSSTSESAQPTWDADGNRVWPGTPAAMVLPDISGLREAELSRMENVIAEAKSAVNRSIEECTRRQLELAGQIERTTGRFSQRTGKRDGICER